MARRLIDFLPMQLKLARVESHKPLLPCECTGCWIIIIRSPPTKDKKVQKWAKWLKWVKIGEYG